MDNSEKNKPENVNAIKKRVLKRIADLKKKIQSNEATPERVQDYDLLLEIDSKLEEALDNWYF